jgi:hypothetical protein
MRLSKRGQNATNIIGIPPQSDPMAISFYDLKKCFEIFAPRNYLHLKTLPTRIFGKTLNKKLMQI